MAKLSFDLIKDSKQGVIELETFNRILQGDIYDYEEIRMDKPTDYTNGFEYVGLAPTGSSIFDPVWSCVRCTWVNMKKTRMQFRANMPWDLRINGWDN